MSESSSEAPSVIEVSDADMAAAAAEETSEGAEETGGPFSQKTAWVRHMETPLRMLLAHRDRQRLGAGRRHRARPDLGEREHLVLRPVLGDPAVGAGRQLEPVSRPAGVRELRADGAVLPGRRAGGAARVRRRRTAGAEQAHAAAAGRAERHGRAHRHLPDRERRASRHSRLGHGDVHRHRVRPGRARPGRAQASGSRPHLPAHLLGRRRPGRPGGHRDLLQRAHRDGGAGLGVRLHRPGPGAAGARQPERDLCTCSSGSRPGCRSSSRAWTRSWSAWSSAC